MAPHAKRPPRPALAPDQLDLARVLYLRLGATAKWVADQLDPPCDWHTVVAAARHLGWDVEREHLSDARKARAKPNAEAQIALEVEQDERAAARARREWDLRDLLLERAFSDVSTMTPKEARRALQVVTGMKDLQFVERLARGRMTDRTSVEDASADEFRRKFFDAVQADLALAPAEQPADGAPAVERGDGAHPEQVAGTPRGGPAS